MEDISIKICGELTKNHEEININNIISYSRSMSSYTENIIKAWNEKFNNYYIYFVDGDNWGQQPRWLNRNTNSDYMDKEVAIQLHNLIEYKDSMIMFADEFILFSNKELDEELMKINSTLEFTFSVLKITVANGFEYKDYKDFKAKVYSYFHKLNEKKYKFGKGKIYEEVK